MKQHTNEQLETRLEEARSQAVFFESENYPATANIYAQKVNAIVAELEKRKATKQIARLRAAPQPDGDDLVDHELWQEFTESEEADTAFLNWLDKQ